MSFLGYHSAVLESSSGILSLILLHELPAFQQYLVGSYLEDTYAR